MSSTPFDDLSEAALMRLLGEAWYTENFKARCGEVYFLDTFADVGRREFDAVAPGLSIAAFADRDITVTPMIVESALSRSAQWNMPVGVVTALARRRGMFAMASAE